MRQLSQERRPFAVQMIAGEKQNIGESEITLFREVHHRCWKGITQTGFRHCVSVMLGVEQGWNVLLEGIGDVRREKRGFYKCLRALWSLRFVGCIDVDGEEIGEVYMDSSCNNMLYIDRSMKNIYLLLL